MAAEVARYNPGWDDEVVPALRKRLEGESRTLTHRMSIIEDNLPPPPPSTRPNPSRPSTSSSSSRKAFSKHPNGSAPLLAAPSRTLHQQPSQSSINLPPPASKSYIPHEPIPVKSTRRASIDSLASSASSQQPFEHWYRGDTSRNGGVGELRVGRRQEMLDIANYGHTLAQREAREQDVAQQKAQRRRADSVNALNRNSFYMDDASDPGARVQDENPPTDVETSDYPYEDDDYADPNEVDPNYYDEDSIATGFAPPPPEEDRTSTPTPTRIPIRGGSEPPPALPPSSPSNTVKASTLSTPKARSPSATRSPKSSPSPAVVNGKSASVNSKDPRKNTRLAASQATRQRVESIRKQEKENQDRRSIAMYPELDPNTTPESIPHMSSYSPPSVNGKWDDVVLPAVARKKGLSTPSPEANRSTDPLGSNSSPPQQTAPGAQEPAEPGVGIIGSSLQQRRSDGYNAYELDEFGGQRHPFPRNPHDSVPIPTMQQRPGQGPYQPPPPNQQQHQTDPPFGRYAPPAPRADTVQPPGGARPYEPMNGSAKILEEGGMHGGKGKEEKGGCCCVIM